MLSFWHGDTAAGLYGAAYRVWEALGMIPSSFLDALFPELSRSSAHPEGLARLRALYRRGQRYTWIGILVLVVPAQLLAGAAIGFLYGRTPDTTIHVNLLRVLLLAFPFTYLYLLNGHTLYALGLQRQVTVAMVAVTAANGVCNALLVPRWSSAGAAAAKLLSEALLFVLLWATLRRAFLRPPATERSERGA
jgi:O-antigen/teichoic acid export membrane protein